jgi:hypothetical protein
MSYTLTATTPTVDKSFWDSYYLTRPEFPISETPQGYGHAWFSASYRGKVVKCKLFWTLDIKYLHVYYFNLWTNLAGFKTLFVYDEFTY